MPKIISSLKIFLEKMKYRNLLFYIELKTGDVKNAYQFFELKKMIAEIPL
jgi:hypothetical protein